MQKRNSRDELDGLLEFPGGKIELGESPRDAALRETYEETGVRLDPLKLKLLKVYDDKKKSKTISLNIFSYFDSGEFSGSWYNKPEEYWEFIPPANQIFLSDILKLLKTTT